MTHNFHLFHKCCLMAKQIQAAEVISGVGFSFGIFLLFFFFPEKPHQAVQGALKWGAKQATVSQTAGGKQALRGASENLLRKAG